MKATGVLLYPLFSEYELSVALSVLKQGNHPIVTIGPEPGPVRGESDLVCLTDTTVDAVDVRKLDSLLLPGCMDVFAVRGHLGLIDLLKRASFEPGMLFAAISSSPCLLAQAGLLRNRRYTVGLTKEARSMAGCLDEAYYSSDLVVQDGPVITARGRAFVEFGIRLGEALELDFYREWYGRGEEVDA